MTFPMKGIQMPTSGKRSRSRIDEDMSDGKKVRKYDLSSVMGSSNMLNRNRIYNIGVRKKPAELFRKDLISAMKMADSDQLCPEEYLLITDPWKEEWEKGVQVPVNPDSLPLANILTVDESQRIKHPSPISPSKSPIADKHKNTPLKSPKKSLRKFEPDRDSLASLYELDLTDHCWLESLTGSEDSIRIPENIFEEIMNELEYQCTKNMKAKHVGIEFDDHIVCDVCRSPDAEDGNEMVFCDSCNICVHQACYGIPVIPDGEWKCKPCTELGSQSQKTVSCVLCPNSGGAFKPTSNNKWAHVSCALWIPEVSIGCVTNMEPITKVKSIPPSRWALVCNLCNIKQGAPIQCSVSTCKVAYHVTCAFNNNLKMKAVVEGDSKGVNLKSFCPRHSEDEGNSRRHRLSSSDSDDRISNRREIDIANPKFFESDKNNRFWMYIDINEINRALMQKRSKKEFKNISVTNLQMYIDLVLQYWKLKRTSNCGLPLIKVVTADTIEEIETARRNDILRLRVNLERIRNLSYMICRREKLKRSWLVSHYTSICKSISMSTGIPILQLLEAEEPATDSSPVRQLFVSDEKISLVKNIVHSNNIYAQDLSVDKLRAKRVVKDLNRLMELDKLRKRRPNPYARTFLPQIKRSGSMSSSCDYEILQDQVISASKASVTPLKKSPSPNFNHKHHSSMPKKCLFGDQKSYLMNGSSLLVKNVVSPHKRTFSPEPILSAVNLRNLSPARSPTSSTENMGTSILVKSGKKKSPNPRSPKKLNHSSPYKDKPMNGDAGMEYHNHKSSRKMMSNGRSSCSSRSIDDDEDDMVVDEIHSLIRVTDEADDVITISRHHDKRISNRDSKFKPNFTSGHGNPSSSEKRFHLRNLTRSQQQNWNAETRRTLFQ